MPAPSPAKPACLTCGYDLSSATPVDGAYLCPECGERSTEYDVQHPPRNRIHVIFACMTVTPILACIPGYWGATYYIGPIAYAIPIASAVCVPLIVGTYFHIEVRPFYRSFVRKCMLMWMLVGLLAVIASIVVIMIVEAWRVA